MKKSAYAVLLIFIVVASFLGGARYSRQGAGGNEDGRAGRRILYYQDPMNPSHTSDKPGVAPCGMALEPVYEGEETTAKGHEPMPRGTVKITPQKQQLIGVQVAAVQAVSETHTVRTLGRVVSDENRVYRILAGESGWMWDVNESTTGSLVEKDQLMGTLYNYLLLGRMQQYLYALDIKDRKRPEAGQHAYNMQHAHGLPSPTPQPPAVAEDLPHAQQPEGLHASSCNHTLPGAQQATDAQQAMSTQQQMSAQPAMSAEPQMSAEPPVGTQQSAGLPQTPSPERASSTHQLAKERAGPLQREPENAAGGQALETDEYHAAEQVVVERPKEYTYEPEVEPMPPTGPARREFTVSEDIYSEVETTPGVNNSGMLFALNDPLELAILELYNLGASEYQLKEIARTRKATTKLEIRSPVTGLVLARNVSPQQRFEKGTELFRIADVSRVWIMADIFWREAEYVKPGTRAKVSIPDHGKVFEAVVADIPSQFDPVTRALRVRLEMENPGLVLRPDMFVDVEFLVPLPSTIAVPFDAVLNAGLKKTVFVDRGDGFFEPREVRTGWRFGDRVQIVEGLAPGEKIVVAGTFLIDSESKMKIAAAGFSSTTGKDPVCGMDVPMDAAKEAGLTAESGGKTLYFCSEECKQHYPKGKADGSPAKPPVTTDGYRGQDGQEGHEGHQGHEKMAAVAPPSAPAKKADLCPVCSMVVSTEKARATKRVSRFQDKDYFLCSDVCKNRFELNPGQYLTEKKGGERSPASHAAISCVPGAQGGKRTQHD